MPNLNGKQKVYDQYFENDGILYAKNEEHKNLFEIIRKCEIKKEWFYSPFGMIRKIVYCDYTASGRPLECIEEYIRNEVLPSYGNTHTTITETSNQTTLFRQEARAIIKKSVNANENDVLIFTGSGSTSAIHKMIRVMDFKTPPVVFLSPYEHHSNILIWREITDHVITIAEDEDGKVDLNDLERRLKHYSSNPKYAKHLIGSFSAASNVTGILTDIDDIAILMHKYGGLAFFDYAAAAPYVRIDMNPRSIENDDSYLAYKDALFISTHKFVGGPQTPGILIAKSKLFQNAVPDGCGGGTVFFVTENDHEYLKNIEEREEGGTPAIIESIRAGLVFQLKDDCHAEMVMQKEQYYATKVIKKLKEIRNLKLLGSVTAERLPIFSFLIQHEDSGYYLHHNLVSALLNDLFGIQTRSGCACAGPYAQKLLGISPDLAKLYIQLMKNGSIYSCSEGYGIFKPGFTRFSVVYFMDEETVDYVLECIKYVAVYGWLFLPYYDFDIKSGIWRFKSYFLNKTNYHKLSDISYTGYKELYKDYKTTNIDTNFEVYLEEAFKLVRHLTSEFYDTKGGLISVTHPEFDIGIKKLVWFLLPMQAYEYIYNKLFPEEQHFQTNKIEPPFKVKEFNYE